MEVGTGASVEVGMGLSGGGDGGLSGGEMAAWWGPQEKKS